MQYDYGFQVSSGNVRFGQGVTREIGLDLCDRGVKKVMVVTDAHMKKLPPTEVVLESLSREEISHSVFDHVQIEPTDSSFKEAIEFAKSQPFDAFVAVGGGSSIDTAKAANLYSTYPTKDLLDYVSPPIGKGKPVPGPLKPLYAIPTTAGTGSESTGIVIFDFEEIHTKTGVVNGYLRPTLGIVDPDNTRTQPPLVAASTGLDILINAVESYTALPFNKRIRADRPNQRPLHQGSNPLTDLWCLQIMRITNEYIERAVEDPQDDEARSMMLMAVSLGKLGFGYAGCHLPHGLSYPVAGMVRDYRPDGYPLVDHPFVPHGIAVVATGPATVRFTAPACAEKHLLAAEALGADVSGVKAEDAGKILADRIIYFMRRLKMPNGLTALGYTRGDIPKLVEGALPQQRLLRLSPRSVGPDELAQIFEDAMVYW